MAVHADPRLHELSSRSVLQPGVAFAAVAACVLLVFGLFWSTTASMIEIWRRSETFQHCFAVIPISLWLVWNERVTLAATPVRPFLPGLVAIALLGVAWLLGVLGAAQVVSQFALIGLVAAIVLTAFGTAWMRVIWFPLLFLVFAVPFGEALVPRLMDWTAEVTIAALRMSGVPVYREGVHFVIPTGQWSVIEACSGIKFLIASIMAGSLYAWLMYRSPGRRLAFLAASIAVPLVANWLRAYSIVMIGHLSHNRLMTNDDHIVFGWILFGAIMLLLYWMGARWREDVAQASQPPPAAAPPWGRMGAVSLAVVAAAAAWPALAHVLMQPVGEPGQVTVVAPEAIQGWQREPRHVSDWTPDLDGANAIQVFTYRKGAQTVSLLVAAYRHQTQAAQVGSTANQFALTTNERWKQTARGSQTTVDDGAAAGPLRTAEMRDQRSSARLLVWQWFWSGNEPTASAAKTKLDLARARLLRKPDTALWIAVYAPLGEDRSKAQAALSDFLRDMGPSLQGAFAATVKP